MLCMHAAIRLLGDRAIPTRGAVQAQMLGHGPPSSYAGSVAHGPWGPVPASVDAHGNMLASLSHPSAFSSVHTGEYGPYKPRVSGDAAAEPYPGHHMLHSGSGGAGTVTTSSNGTRVPSMPRFLAGHPSWEYADRMRSSAASGHSRAPPFAMTAATTLDMTTTPSLPRPTRDGAMLNRDLLENALDALSGRGQLFMRRFELLGPMNRRIGGQGVVQFARVAASGEGVAIKFFLNRNAFRCEEELYVREGLRDMMPAISLIENNDSVRPRMHGNTGLPAAAAASLS
jgi:hypothetical protein